MATLLLDTSIMIDTINEKKNRRQFLYGLVQQGNILACCPINVAEIYAGMRSKEEAKTTHFLSSLDYYPVSFSVARLAGEMKRDFGRKGTTLSLADSLIAAVAIQFHLSLVTDNTKDFPMKDLHLHPLPNET
jgi:predicted nucleic acid-binding protein